MEKGSIDNAKQSNDTWRKKLTKTKILFESGSILMTDRI